MPTATSSNISHVAQSDHRVLRKYSSEKKHQHELDDEQAVMIVVGEKENLIPDQELDRAKAIMQVRVAEGIQNPELAARTIPFLEKWVKAVPDDLEAALTLGVAFQLLHAQTEAIEVWKNTLKKQPRNELILRRLMFVYLEMNQAASSVEFSQRLVDVIPWDAEYFGYHAQILAELKRFDEAIAAAKRSLKLNPGQPQIHELLARIYEAHNKPEESNFHQQKMEQMLK